MPETRGSVRGRRRACEPIERMVPFHRTNGIAGAACKYFCHTILATRMLYGTTWFIDAISRQQTQANIETFQMVLLRKSSSIKCIKKCQQPFVQLCTSWKRWDYILSVLSKKLTRPYVACVKRSGAAFPAERRQRPAAASDTRPFMANVRAGMCPDSSPHAMRSSEQSSMVMATL